MVSMSLDFRTRSEGGGEEAWMLVKDLMSTPAVTVDADMTVTDVLEFWYSRPFSGYPVVSDGELVGVLSETDLLYLNRPVDPPAYVSLFDVILKLESPHHLQQELRRRVGSKVRDVMSAPPITIRWDQDLADAAFRMTERHVNRLVVVDEEGRLAGVITRSDLLRALVKKRLPLYR